MYHPDLGYASPFSLGAYESPTGSSDDSGDYPNQAFTFENGSSSAFGLSWTPHVDEGYHPDPRKIAIITRHNSVPWTTASSEASPRLLLESGSLTHGVTPFELWSPSPTDHYPSHDLANTFMKFTPSSNAMGYSSNNAEASGSGASSSNPPPPVIACRQCRARKIKCDSTRPQCTNCNRRQNECQYDAAPKRRGPDKEPGTRKRTCKTRPVEGGGAPPAKRKRTTRAQGPNTSGIHHMVEPVNMKRSLPPVIFPQTRPPNLAVNTKVPHVMHSLQGMLNPELTPASATSSHSYAPDSRINAYQGPRPVQRYEASPVSAADPGYRRLWWDDLLREYSSPPEDSLEDIIHDLEFLFESTTYWLSFMNASEIIIVISHPQRRLALQPALILAGLALATLMKSSQSELGHAGRERALWLRRRAQEKLEASWDQGWVDSMLAEAALMLALFESCPHPRYEPTRETIAIKFMDDIIRSLGLTSVDALDPDVCPFESRQIPIVFVRGAEPLSPEPLQETTPTPEGHPTVRRTCACLPGATLLEEHHFATSWSYPLPWDPAWTSEEARAEASRRLVWSALNLVAIYTSQCSVLGKVPADLHLSDPANFRVLFPGEVSDRLAPNFRAAGISPKDSVWALYCRSMLLWNFCGRLPTSMYDNDEKTTLSMAAWQETQAIEDALDAHSCNLDTVLLYMCREYLNNARMGITQCFRSLQGLDSAKNPSGPRFTRSQANEWLHYQHNLIRRAESSIANLDGEGHILTRRPFQAFWFTTQLGICLSLWRHDDELVDALQLAKSVLVIVDVLNLLWPCAYQQSRCDALRQELQDAARKKNLPPVLPVGYNLPPLLRALTA